MSNRVVVSNKVGRRPLREAVPPYENGNVD